jgi:amidase
VGSGAEQAALRRAQRAEGERGPELCFTPARELARRLRARELSARELMQATLAQIARVNPRVNAIVAKLEDDACLALADAADAKLARGEPVGALHGLPIAIKDMQQAAGFPCTLGSPLFARSVPVEDSMLVARIRRAGALIIGKTNVPEFGLGSHTYNSVYGTTRNPYDVAKSAGGSSGGAGAALATGMLAIADGSDYGGSLRNPANWNNVVALRPSVGLVPTAPALMPTASWVVNGPMARSVADVAWLLSVFAGPDARDPGCRDSDPASFAAPLARELGGARIAWSLDLGALPLDSRVRDVLAAQRATFEALGCLVEEAQPDLTNVDECFRTIRAWSVAAQLGPLLERHRAQLKPAAIEEIEAGQLLSGADVARAFAQHAQILTRTSEFFARYEFLVSAVNQIPPFDAALDWPKSIDGAAMENYLAWMRSAYWLTATHGPALSAPAGFTPEGLPVGVQISGARGRDFAVLQLAHAFEQATRFGERRPALAL